MNYILPDCSCGKFVGSVAICAPCFANELDRVRMEERSAILAIVTEIEESAHAAKRNTVDLTAAKQKIGERA